MRILDMMTIRDVDNQKYIASKRW